MNNYEAIQKYIDEARLQRSVYLAELAADTIVAGINLIKKGVGCLKLAAESTIKGSANRPIRNKSIFTFDS